MTLSSRQEPGARGPAEGASRRSHTTLGRKSGCGCGLRAESPARSVLHRVGRDVSRSRTPRPGRLVEPYFFLWTELSPASSWRMTPRRASMSSLLSTLDLVNERLSLNGPPLGL